MEYSESEANRVYGRAVFRPQLDLRFAVIFREIPSMILHLHVRLWFLKNNHERDGWSASHQREGITLAFSGTCVLLESPKNSRWEISEQLCEFTLLLSQCKLAFDDS
jgi:hypothetical protein